MFLGLSVLFLTLMVTGFDTSPYEKIGLVASPGSHGGITLPSIPLPTQVKPTLPRATTNQPPTTETDDELEPDDELDDEPYHLPTNPKEPTNLPRLNTPKQLPTPGQPTGTNDVRALSTTPEPVPGPTTPTLNQPTVTPQPTPPPTTKPKPTPVTPTQKTKPVVPPTSTTDTAKPKHAPVQKSTVRESNIKLRKRVEELTVPKKVLDDRRAQKTYLRIDSDGDGILDYDEIAIYGTDPFNAHTASGTETDGERLLLGLDPRSTTSAPIAYEDPRDFIGTTAQTYTVTEITLATSTTSSGPPVETLSFSGVAEPNAFITLYIFSTPIVVTVRADANGEWTYELDQELEDGSHEVYVATVNASGNILAQSERIPFVKEAQAVGLGEALPAAIEAVESEEAKGFFAQYFMAIALSVIVFGILAIVLVIGLRRREEPIAVVDTPDEGHQNNE